MQQPIIQDRGQPSEVLRPFREALAEAGVLPAIVDPLWDINPPVRADGTVPAFHENGTVGGILKGLFGWNGNPSALEVIGWCAYLAAITAVVVVRRLRDASPHDARTRG